ncbi:DMT family transporter [Marinomonas sp. 2405UD68-3]|uniref:DMT family transporter n=1 Tax=Marinomonas sp. 2405UD68-3 TaxID=3391835 RepID=UPI0039C90819
MTFVELSGLIAAFCWTLSSLMAPKLITAFGVMRFNTFRIIIAAFILLCISVISNRFDHTILAHSRSLVLSGVVGIVIGDSLLFAAVSRLGPRRAGVLFATNAPISICLGWVLFNEALSLVELFACFIVLAGVIVAILFGKRTYQEHAWEETRGKLYVGILMGLGGALGQASGALLSKPALLDGADSIAVSSIRVSSGAITLLLAYHLYYKRRSASLKPFIFRDIPLAIYGQLAIMACIGMVIGMSILVWGIGKGNIGIVTTLSATTPVLILPAIWLTTGQNPTIGAWTGSALVVIGASMIMLF